MKPFGLTYKTQIFHRRFVHIQRRLLRQIANQFFCFACIFKDAVTINFNASLCSRQTAGHNVHGGGFSGAVWPQKAIYMSLVDFERKVIDCLEAAIAFGQMFDRYHVFASIPVCYALSAFPC